MFFSVSQVTSLADPKKDAFLTLDLEGRERDGDKEEEEEEEEELCVTRSSRLLYRSTNQTDALRFGRAMCVSTRRASEQKNGTRETLFLSFSN